MSKKKPILSEEEFNKIIYLMPDGLGGKYAEFSKFSIDKQKEILDKMHRNLYAIHATLGISKEAGVYASRSEVYAAYRKKLIAYYEYKISKKEHDSRLYQSLLDDIKLDDELNKDGPLKEDWKSFNIEFASDLSDFRRMDEDIKRNKDVDAFNVNMIKIAQEVVEDVKKDEKPSYGFHYDGKPRSGGMSSGSDENVHSR